MTSPASPSTPDLARPAALAAFLRGVERRAAVLAELHAGDATLGDAALTRAMAAFRLHALEAGMAEWPRLFWAELLGQPALRRARRARPPAFVPACSAPIRAALLLRLAAGLDERDAAAVLGVSERSLRRAVLRALPCLPDGAPDPAAWSDLQAQVQQRIRALPTERSLRLARMREAALAGPAQRYFPTRTRSRAGRAALGVAAAGAAALAATFWFGPSPDPQVRVVPLARAGEPASRYSATAGLVAHPDFDLLADPAAERLAREAAFLAWTVGRQTVPAPPVEPEETAMQVPETSASNDAP